jgi:MFS family permease
MGGSFLLLGVAPGLLTVAVALLVWGTAASVYHPAGLTLVSTGVTDRGTGFAYHGVAGNLGIGLGPLVTTLLLLAFDWSTVAAVLALPAVAAGAYVLRAEFDETAAVEVATDGGTADAVAGSGVDSFAEFLGESRRLLAGAFVVVFAVVVFSGLFYRGVLTFLPAVLEGVPGFEPIPLASVVSGLPETGLTLRPERYVYAGLLLVGIVGQYVGGKLTDRVPPAVGIAVAFGALAVLALGFLPAASMGIGPLLAVGALLAVALFAVQPLYQATIADHTPAGSRGLSYGYTYLGTFGVGALGGVGAGAVLTYADAGTLFVLLAGVAGLAATLSLALLRRHRPTGA